ncbi:MAG: DNA cytosine methyltransferase [Symploca sp. SIO3C6]|nr:DNA cytosine methyltransferase [Symploca sp. SIO3C6]
MQQLSLSLNLPEPKSKTTTWLQEILASLGISRIPTWQDQFGLSISNWLREHNHSPIKTLSLFSGGGGLDIAFHDCGFEIVQMVEIQAKYVETLKKNSQPGKWLEKSQPVCIDIRNFVPSAQLKVDFIIGGPPCQTFSAAGRRAAGVAGTSDTRGNLFKEYIRLLKTLKPQGFLFENVYGITGAQQGEAWQQIQAGFKEAGYTLYFRILDAADYGVPQHRERLFIVGLRTGNYLFPYPTHGPDSPGEEPFYTAGAAVVGAESKDIELGIGGKYGYLLTDIPPGLNYSFYTKEMGYPQPVFSWRSKFSDFLYKADPKMPVRTIKAKGGQYTGPFSWENRRFSVAELKRLQTIPDAYELEGNRSVCIEQIGNSVPPQLARILALSILEQVMGVKLPFVMNYLSSEKKLGFRRRKRQLTTRYAQKAKEAIALLKDSGKFTATTKTDSVTQGQVVRFLSTDFAWTEQEVSNSTKILVKYDLKPDCWRIAVSSSIQREPFIFTSPHPKSLPQNWDRDFKNSLPIQNQDKNQYVIDLCPSTGYEDWGLNTKMVKLEAQELDPQVFTALWKAFEEQLVEFTHKADLVQLSGYYQYQPQITAILTFQPRLKVDSLWRVIQAVVRGIGVAQQLSAQSLALLWGVEADEIFSHLQSLRGMGYEVRNYNTNSQIPQGKYLIPYAFPTLTPRSVQLRKNLGDCRD